MRIRSISVFVIACSLTFLGLGTWQVARLRYKEHVIRSLSNPPIELAGKIENRHKYVNARIRGSFIRPVYYLYYSNDNYHVIEPFLTDRGQYILVNRGLIAKEKINRLMKHLKINKQISISGTLYAPSKIASFFFSNDTKNNILFFLDPGKIGSEQHLSPMSNLVLFGNSTTVAGEIKKNGKIDVWNKHKEYAITWYSLAIMTIIIWIFNKKNRK